MIATNRAHRRAESSGSESRTSSSRPMPPQKVRKEVRSYLQQQRVTAFDRKQRRNSQNTQQVSSRPIHPQERKRAAQKAQNIGSRISPFSLRLWSKNSSRLERCRTRTAISRVAPSKREKRIPPDITDIYIETRNRVDRWLSRSVLSKQASRAAR